MKNPTQTNKLPTPITNIWAPGTPIFPPSDELAPEVVPAVAAVAAPDVPPSGIIPFVNPKAEVSNIGTVNLAVLNAVGTVKLGEIEVPAAVVLAAVCALTAVLMRRRSDKR